MASDGDSFQSDNNSAASTSEQQRRRIEEYCEETAAQLGQNQATLHQDPGVFQDPQPQSSVVGGSSFVPSTQSQFHHTFPGSHGPFNPYQYAHHQQAQPGPSQNDFGRQPEGGTSTGTITPNALGSYASLTETNTPDDDTTDVDSAYESESLLGDDTKSLASYITDYRFEHGRRYQNFREGAYWGPNDEHANDSQDLAHHIYLLTLDGKLHLAPIHEPQNILDVGTGTGIWAVDMADQYPSAQVIGVDLSPIQPTFVPPNCIFEVDDVTLEWTYPSNHFDFIHVREMFGSIGDWDSFFREVYRCMAPGGWVEVVEHSVEPIADDDTQPPNHFYWSWGKTVVDMGRLNGRSFTIWKEAKARLLRAGFVDVVEVPYNWPMNGWPDEPKLREIGRWNQARLHNGVEGFMLRLLTAIGNWTYEEAQVYLAVMRRSIRDYSCHAYLPGTVVYARKP